MNASQVAGTCLFECRDVHYAYQGKFPALCGVDMTIVKGERIALLGANGSGKSTLLNLLDGLIVPDQGGIWYEGRELTESALMEERFAVEFRRSVGFVFQNPDVQLFCPTVREDIAFGPLQMGLVPEAVHARVESAAEEMGVRALLDRSPHQLSVGEKRKVSLATILAIDPAVFLLDEPTAGLDPKTTTHLIERLVAFARAGKTVITATHDLHILEDIADMVYVFGQNKRLVGRGSPAEILADGALLRENNLAHAHVHHARDHHRYHLDG